MSGGAAADETRQVKNSAMGFGIVQRTFRNRVFCHFLKAQGLGTKLHLIGAMQFGLAAFVFDRERALSLGAIDELHQIGHPGQVQPG
jgi:hypothetical protein